MKYNERMRNRAKRLPDLPPLTTEKLVSLANQRYSYTQIADILDCTESSISKWILHGSSMSYDTAMILWRKMKRDYNRANR